MKLKYLVDRTAGIFNPDPMLWYPLLLIVHFLGLIALFGFFVLYARAGARLRAAADARDAGTWLDLVDTARPMLSGGAAMLLASGIVLAGLRWRGPYPFTAVGLATVLVAWVTGAMISRRQLDSMRLLIGGAQASELPRLSDALARTGGWISMTMLNGAVFGVLVIMTVKPGWAWSIGIVLAGGIIGATAMAVALRRRPQ